MFCPSCGSEAKSEQKFCRACGFNLQPILPLLGEHAQAPKVPEKVRRVLQKIGYVGIGMGAGGILVIVGMIVWALLAMAFLGPEATEQLNPIWNRMLGIGLLLLLKGAFVFAVPWLLKEFFPWKSAQPSSVAAAKTKELLPEPPLASIASVTEHTIHHLEPELHNRARQAE